MSWVDSPRRLYEGRFTAFQGEFCILCTSKTRAPRISSRRTKDVLLLTVIKRELNHQQGSFLIFNSERQYRTLYSLILSSLPPHTIDQFRLPSYLFRRDFYLIFVYGPIRFHSKTSVPSFRIHLGAQIAVLTKSNIALNVLRLILRSWVIPRRVLQLLSINRDSIV